MRMESHCITIHRIVCICAYVSGTLCMWSSYIHVSMLLSCRVRFTTSLQIDIDEMPTVFFFRLVFIVFRVDTMSCSHSLRLVLSRTHCQKWQCARVRYCNADNVCTMCFVTILMAFPFGLLQQSKSIFTVKIIWIIIHIKMLNWNLIETNDAAGRGLDNCV